MAFSISETTLLSAVTGGSLTSILTSVLEPGYSITFNTKPSNDPLKASIGADVFTPTSWVSVEVVSDASAVTAPIEQGSFNSYNKVKKPREIRVAFTLEGWTGYSGAIPNLTNFTTLSREKMITLLESMRTSTYTYNIETPDTVYKSFDLVRFDYATRSGQGVTLLTVNATFQEIMQVAETSTSSDKTNNDKCSLGSSCNTPKTQGNTEDVTLDDVKKAWSSATGSLSTALSTTADYAVSEINSAATSASTAFEKSSDAVASQIKNGVSKLVSLL